MWIHFNNEEVEPHTSKININTYIVDYILNLDYTMLRRKLFSLHFYFYFPLILLFLIWTDI